MASGPIKYYDRGIWKRISAVCVLAIMLAMLLGPMWSLPFIVSIAKRLALVTAFALGFSLFVVIGTTLKGFQRLILIARCVSKCSLTEAVVDLSDSYFVQLILVFAFVPIWTNSVAATDVVVSPYDSRSF